MAVTLKRPYCHSSRRDFLRLAGVGFAAIATKAHGDEPVPPKFVASWGTNGHGDGQFDVPIAIAIRNDEIFVSDFRQSDPEAKGRIQRFNLDGQFLSSFLVEPMPGAIAFDKEGRFYITHMMRHKVAIYKPNGDLVSQFGGQGTENGRLQQPGGIVFGPDGSVYIADQVNRRVQRFTAEGAFIAAWGKYGTAPGEFGGNVSMPSRVGGPHFLAFDRDGNLYTTEGSVGRIQKFTVEGKFVLAWGDNEVGPGHFGGATGLKGPIAIAIDAKDRVWVSATNHHIQQFTTDGRYVTGVGGEGSESGQFHTPHGLAFDSQGHLYVADMRNSRIQKFAL